MNHDRLRELLRDAPMPDEREAEERGWRVVRAALESHPPTVRRPGARRWAIAVVLGLLILAIGLSPAGAKVADLVDEAIHPGEGNAQRKLTSLPAPGRLLATSPHGAWVVAQDGSKRRLGSYNDATWSPSGLFVAVARGRELTAVKPDGTVRWSLSAGRSVSDPVWAPSGLRIAYRAGNAVRLVAGNGADDRLLAHRAAPTPPAWAPESDRNILAFVGPNGTVRAVDVESGQSLWRSARFGGGVQSLEWSSTGRLLVMARSFFVILDQRGHAISKGPAGGPAEAAAFSPDGRAIALARRTGRRSELVILRTGPANPVERRLFAGGGRFTDIAWSPGGTWLLLGWRDADQWLFVHPADRKVVSVSEISRQFAPGITRTVGFPRVAGWCCTP
jgi:WD40 repeat protein